MGILITEEDKPVPVFREGYGLETLAADVAVSKLTATSHPDGGRIDLSWTNPAGATHIKILRRQQSFAYDLTDPGVLVYNGVVKSTHSDTALEEQTYFYYLVAVSTDGGTTYKFENSSRVFQLSISTTLNSKDFMWNIVPLEYKRLDMENNGELEKLIDVLSAAMNIIRGRLNALPLMNDPDKSPLHILLHQLASLGFDPELAFDFNTSRRALGSLIGVLKDKGDYNGMVEFIRFFVQWEITLVEFGIGAGSNAFQTYGGTLNKAEAHSGAGITVADRSLTDTGRAWTPSQWKDGFLLDAIGNVIPVLDNTSQSLTLKQSTTRASVRVAVTAGATTIPVDTTLGWAPGMRFTIKEGALVESGVVFSFNAGPSFSVTAPLQNSYTTAAKLTRVPTLPMMQVISQGTGSGSTMQGSDTTWGVNQWAGYEYIDTGNVVRTVISNTSDTLTLSGAAVTGAFALAWGITAGANFAARVITPWYTVGSGQHSWLYEPRLCRGLMGTSDDPFQYLYGGAGSILAPSMGAGDIGIYIQNVAVAYGESVNLTSTLLAGNELFGKAIDFYKGMWLNPNRNQTKLFKITSSDAIGQVNVAAGSGMTGFGATGDSYFILTDRDARKYLRLVERAKEFAPRNTQLYFFFE